MKAGKRYSIESTSFCVVPAPHLFPLDQNGRFLLVLKLCVIFFSILAFKIFHKCLIGLKSGDGFGCLSNWIQPFLSILDYFGKSICAWIWTIETLASALSTHSQVSEIFSIFLKWVSSLCFHSVTAPLLCYL